MAARRRTSRRQTPRQHTARSKARLSYVGSSYARRLRVEELEDRRMLALYTPPITNPSFESPDTDTVAGNFIAFQHASDSDRGFWYAEATNPTLGAAFFHEDTTTPATDIPHTPYGDQWLQLISDPNTPGAVYHNIGTWNPDVDYIVSMEIGNRGALPGSSFQVELWAGGNDFAASNEHPLMSNGNPFTSVGATLVDDSGQQAIVPVLTTDTVSFVLNTGNGSFTPNDDFLWIRLTQMGPLGTNDSVLFDNINIIDASTVGLLHVTTATDELDFTNTDVSLREAIAAANAIDGADTITFDAGLSGQTINIHSQLPTITDDLTIDGGNQITIDAGGGINGTIGNGDGYRIFNIDDGDNGTQIDVTFSGLTLTGGDTTFGESGGAILNSENLTLTNTVLAGNFASDGGGALHNLPSGIATVNASTVSGNFSTGGGGIKNEGLTYLNDSTLSGNQATQLEGGGISNEGTGTLQVSNTTLSGNSGVGYGGGISNFGSATVTGSTFSNNTGFPNGAAIVNRDGSTNLTNTIVDDSGTGDDIYVLGGSVSGSYNLIEDGSQLASFTNSFMGDPLLGPLADNGGPTQTHSLLPGSPAINAGDPAIVASPTEFDQRGTGFERVQLGRADIGAFEFQTELPPQGLVVSTLSDSIDTDFSVGELSLREAITIANELPGAHTITFSSLFDTAQEIDLILGQLEITDTLTLTGPGQDLLTIDAQQSSRVLHFSENTGDLTLAGLTVTGGLTTAGVSGGGIRFDSLGSLTLLDSLVTNNAAGDGLPGNFGGGGGGIYTGFGMVTLTNSTVSGNSTGAGGSGSIGGNGGVGGGIFTNFGMVTLTNSTVSGNSTGAGGSGFAYNGGNGGYGGGIFTTSGIVTLTNSTVSGNSTGAVGSETAASAAETAAPAAALPRFPAW